jgi:hypothetical protein
MGETDAPQPQASHPIPASLLAIAKDARYLLACQELVQQVLSAFSTTSPEDSADDRFALEASLISSLLYTLFVVVRKKKTLGMEAAGLKYADELARWKIVGLSLVATLSTYAVGRLANNCRNDDPQIASEALRGERRREHFEEQRRAMLERASGNLPSGGIHTRTEANRHTVSPNPRSRRELLFRKLKSHGKLLAQWLSSALSVPLEGPHTVPEENGGQSSQSRSIASWLLRLHLALYCMNGRYASWQHRILGSSFEVSEENRLVNRPTTYRIVGLMILAQAMGTTLRAVSHLMVHSLVNSMESSGPAAITPSIDFGKTSTEFLGEASAMCGICHQVRRHPACPVGCGHVFCWTCLQQWVTTVRPECPICRTNCPSREILPLYNYYPGLREGE